jgi:DNA polymerase III delta prime subunit
MPTTLHHAVLIEGSGETAKNSALLHVINIHGIEVTGNPDVHILEHEKFTIDEARILKERAYRTPLGEKQVFILISETILREAQNALLKLLEEPAPNTYFVIAVPSKHDLLVTVQSRLNYLESAGSDVYKEMSVKKFITATIGERRDMLKDIIKEKDRKRARLFIRELEKLLHSDVKKNAQSLREVAIAQKYISDKSSSVKMLLEHICVTI